MNNLQFLQASQSRKAYWTYDKILSMLDANGKKEFKRAVKKAHTAITKRKVSHAIFIMPIKGNAEFKIFPFPGGYGADGYIVEIIRELTGGEHVYSIHLI